MQNMIATETKHRLIFLDVYRAIACLLVYFYHNAVNLTISGIPFPGCYGVHLFFVLSGVLLGEKFAKWLESEVRDTDIFQKYVTRRFLRIYPPYIICLLAFVLLRIVSGVNPPDFANTVFRILLIFNYIDKYDYFSINGGFWSLAIEMQFYLILPVGIWLMKGRGRPGLLALGISFIVLGAFSRCIETLFVNHSRPEVPSNIHFKWVTSHLDLFGVGVLLSGLDVLKARVKESRKFSLIFLLGIFVLAGVGIWTSVSGHWQESDSLSFTVFGPVVVCLGFACLLVGTAWSPLRDSKFFNSPQLAWVGKISYSFYLYHVGVLFVFNAIFNPLGWGFSWHTATLLTALICLTPALIVGWLFYWLVECWEERIVTIRVIGRKYIARLKKAI